MKRGYIWLVVALCFVSAFLGYGVCRRMYSDNKSINEEIEDDVVALAPQFQKINPSTKMVYEYYYPEDNVTEVYEDSPPYFLIDYTFEDLKRLYPNWTIASFSDKEVVMKKKIAGPSNQRYIIGEEDGYIAVFYDLGDNERMLKEVTDKPLSAFSETERDILTEGIRVTGNDKLYRALENYSS